MYNKLFITFILGLFNITNSYSSLFDTKITNKNQVIKKIEHMNTFKERFKLLKATKIKYFYNNKKSNNLIFPLKIKYFMKPPIDNVPRYLLPNIKFNELWSKFDYNNYKCIINSNYLKISIIIEIYNRNACNKYVNNNVLININCNVLERYKYLPISNSLLEKIITDKMIKIFEIIYN